MRTLNKATLERVKRIIAAYQLKNGVSPSFREIMHAADMSSLNLVARYVAELEKTGAIKKNAAGAIALPPELDPGRSVITPLVGSVACGQPNLSFEYVEESYALPKSLFGNGDLIMLRASGESMIEAGIRNGDLIVIRRQNYADDGEIVLALTDGETTLKRLYRRNGKIILHPENRDMKDIVIKDCEILGVLTGCIKTY